MLEDEIQSASDDEFTYDEAKKTQYVLTQYDDTNTSDSIISHISDSGEPKLVLIDFEYCAYNYRGFDIANHFQEWSYDYTNPKHPFYYENQENSPTLEQKVRNFCNFRVFFCVRWLVLMVFFLVTIEHIFVLDFFFGFFFRFKF